MHTLHLVPFVYAGRKATMASDGALQDVAPTLQAGDAGAAARGGNDRPVARGVGVRVDSLLETPR